MPPELRTKLNEAETVRDMMNVFAEWFDLGKVRPGPMARIGIIEGLSRAIKLLRLK